MHPMPTLQFRGGERRAMVGAMIEHLLEPDFDGVVGRTAEESRPSFRRLPRPGPDAPNVVIVVLDDVGFAQVGCYGSDIATPNIDSIAATGLQFTNFHVTPLCSPTRACLLSGRNHHSVGMGTITGFPSGYPHTRESVSTKAAMLSEVLRERGYGTYAAGKWHLMPMDAVAPAGRFDHWPLARGFDRFYGFLNGETDQYRPNLVRDNHFVLPPSDAGYHLSEDLVDAGEQFVVDHRSSAATRPFFLYLAFGACHGPHQAPPEYRARYRGRYDEGWDETRRRWFRRQLDLGVVPPGTTLAPPNPDVPAWDDLSDDQQRLGARFQEVFSGFLEHTDAQIGRLVEMLRRVGSLDDTLLIVLSDNGAAGEGGPFGNWNEIGQLNGIPADQAGNLARIDELGDASTYPVYPRGWAQAGNSPNKWYKHHTFGGGVRAPLVVQWPRRLAGGRKVDTFQYVTDIVPTVLDGCGTTMPRAIKGIEQLPLHGRAITAITGSSEVDTRRTQYFEMLGHRGIYRDGYKAVTHHTKGDDYTTERWELYYLPDDFSECHDLADAKPELLREMVELWWAEAGRYGVLPLDDRFLERAQDRTGSELGSGDELVLYRGANRVSESAGPDLRGKEFTIATTLHAYEPWQDGVLVSFGGRFGGFVWYVTAGRQHFAYNDLGKATVRADERPLPEGDVDLAVRVTKTGDGTGADVVMSVGGVDGDPFRLDATVPYYAGGNGIEVGGNWLSPVAGTYDQPFVFRGDFDRVVIRSIPADDVADVAAARHRAD
jgi:arylsulfatase A-like enzyme